MSNSNDEWNVKTAEFKGFVKAKLEGIETVMTAFIDSQNEYNKDVDKRMDKFENEQSRMKGIAATIATGVGIVVGIITSVFTKIFRGT